MDVFPCLQQEIDGTPLIYACLYGFIEIAGVLMENGAVVNHLSKVMMKVVMLKL